MFEDLNNIVRENSSKSEKDVDCRFNISVNYLQYNNVLVIKWAGSESCRESFPNCKISRRTTAYWSVSIKSFSALPFLVRNLHGNTLPKEA